MTAILKVDEIQDTSGNLIIKEDSNTITIGKSGDTVNLASGATAGFGKVLQVVTATDGTERNTTSSSFVTGSNTMSLNITPSSTSNKIYLIMSSSGEGGSGSSGFYSIFKDGSALGNTSNGLAVIGSGTIAPIAINYLDSPSTTSQITYDVRFRVGTSGQTAKLVRQNCTSSLTAIEVSA